MIWHDGTPQPRCHCCADLRIRTTDEIYFPRVIWEGQASSSLPISRFRWATREREKGKKTQSGLWTLDSRPCWVQLLVRVQRLTGPHQARWQAVILDLREPQCSTNRPRSFRLSWDYPAIPGPTRIIHTQADKQAGRQAPTEKPLPSRTTLSGYTVLRT